MTMRIDGNGDLFPKKGKTESTDNKQNTEVRFDMSEALKRFAPDDPPANKENEGGNREIKFPNSTIDWEKEEKELDKLRQENEEELQKAYKEGVENYIKEEIKKAEELGLIQRKSDGLSAEGEKPIENPTAIKLPNNLTPEEIKEILSKLPDIKPFEPSTSIKLPNNLTPEEIIQKLKENPSIKLPNNLTLDEIREILSKVPDMTLPETPTSITLPHKLPPEGNITIPSELLEKFKEKLNKTPEDATIEGILSKLKPENLTSPSKVTAEMKERLNKIFSNETEFTDKKGNLKEGVSPAVALNDDGTLKDGWSVDEQGQPHYENPNLSALKEHLKKPATTPGFIETPFGEASPARIDIPGPKPDPTNDIGFRPNKLSFKREIVTYEPVYELNDGKLVNTC